MKKMFIFCALCGIQICQGASDQPIMESNQSAVPQNPSEPGRSRDKARYVSQAYPEAFFDDRNKTLPNWDANKATWHQWGKYLWGYLELVLKDRDGDKDATAQLQKLQDDANAPTADAQTKKYYTFTTRARGQLDRNKDHMADDVAMKSAIEQVVNGAMNAAAK